MIHTKFSFSDGNKIQIFLNEQVVLHADTIKCIIYRGTFILQHYSLSFMDTLANMDPYITLTTMHDIGKK